MESIPRDSINFIDKDAVLSRTVSMDLLKGGENHHTTAGQAAFLEK